MESVSYRIWDNKFRYYCLTLHSKEQAEMMVAHFTKMDKYHKEYMEDRYRIDRV